MPITSASRSVAARHRGVLLPDLDLDFDHHGIVAVATLLADPDRFIGETLADPLEGADYGRCKAKVMRGDDGGLFIHSFAHGRALYVLRRDARSAKAAIAKASVDGLIDYAMVILATTEMEADELEDFVATVAKTAGIGVRAVKARIAKERREREQTQRKAALVSGGDGRIVRPRPEPDGELLPTTTRFSMRFSRPTSGRNPQCGTHRAT
jgi:intracellular sulfur oxidation DsrE/DsrF family protein